MSLLLEPYTLRQLTLLNRIAVSPMCQYSSVDGLANDWHLVHLGSRAVGGAGLIFTEATAVTADGRITAEDLGLWNDEQIEPLQRITRFIAAQGAVAGIQLAHAGRKASTHRPWMGKHGSVKPEDGGWVPVGPSPIAFDPQHTQPKQLDEGADRRGHSGLRRLGQARADRRFQSGGSPRRPRLPVAPVSVAHEQSASGSIRRFVRKPYSSGAASDRSGTRGLA